MNVPSCSTCRWAQPLDKDGQFFECRRLSPQPYPAFYTDLHRTPPPRLESRWPSVGPTDWCGEWSYIAAGEVRYAS